MRVLASISGSPSTCCSCSSHNVANTCPITSKDRLSTRQLGQKNFWQVHAEGLVIFLNSTSILCVYNISLVFGSVYLKAAVAATNKCFGWIAALFIREH
jgi:hypothetical protein